MRHASRISFALECHYDPTTGVLSIGSDAASTRPWYNVLATTKPFVSAPFAATVKLGDQDGVNMPWFSRADATLLFYEIHGDRSNAPFRLQIDRSGDTGFDVFIWAHSMDEQETSWDIVEEVGTWEQPGSRRPLLEMHFTLKDSLNANVSIATQVVDTISVRADSGWSPSLTFPIRQGIVKILAPTFEVLGGIFTFIIFLALSFTHLLIYILGLYVLLVIACYWAAKRPPFWPWARAFLLTKHAVRILGPPTELGKDEKDDANGNGLESSDETTSGPQPLTSVLAFFTSKSPLDDLLVTFEFTKPFVQPLTLSWRRSVPADEEQAPGTSTGIGTQDSAGATRPRNTSLHDTKTEVSGNEEKV
ncbi:hypothetical protein LTR84_009676 [Exophiala bonariae]|uniref:Uncharacterized protein n=1 Tax=Exophiala bonariae TaxID=1690606 RepID=A0AAV9NJE6_9EURO|nr:hypothetical protein LTR84_009676 [Exophiala bonariae]